MCVSFAIPPVTLFICDPLLSYVEMFYSRHTKGRVVLKVATGWSVLFGGGFASPFFLYSYAYNHVDANSVRLLR